MKIRWIMVLLLIGLPICLLQAAVICYAVAVKILDPLASQTNFRLDVEQFVLLFIGLFVVLYVGWTRLIQFIAKRSLRNQPRFFEVIPPKE